MHASPARFAIAATAHNRPDRLRNLLSSIVAAEDFENWPVYLSIEPTPQSEAIRTVIASFAGHLQIQSRVNAEKRGVRRNPFDTVQWVLEQGYDNVLLLEDDLAIDRQALRLAQLLCAGPLHETGAMCANLLMTTCMSESIHVADRPQFDAISDVVLRTRFFSSYGLLFSRRQWQQHFVPNWFCDTPPMENWQGRQATGWDVAMNRLLLSTPGLHVLQSLVPRVTHDGAGGTHVSEAFQVMSFDHVQINMAPELALAAIRILNPVTDLHLVPSRAARMYINLCRHLWTLQESNLVFRHRLPEFADARAHWFRVGGWEYTIHRRRLRKRRASA
jgi:hypothetical protein